MKAVGGTHLRWHGWTIDAYREAFHLRQEIPTFAPGLSAKLRRAAKPRVGHDGFGAPPPAPGATRTSSPAWRSLAHVRPELLSELHPERNGDLDAYRRAAGSHRRLWWRCSVCGHEWAAAVDNRAVRGSGCPRCATIRRAAARPGAAGAVAGGQAARACRRAAPDPKRRVGPVRARRCFYAQGLVAVWRLRPRVAGHGGKPLSWHGLPLMLAQPSEPFPQRTSLVETSSRYDA